MRIVSLLPSATELLFAIGAGHEVVGVTHECDHPAAALAVAPVTANLLPQDEDEDAPASAIDRHIHAARHQGSSIYGLDEVALAALAPDLIVTQELCDVCAVAYADVARAVRRLPGEITVLSLEPATLDDILATVLTLGEATGHVVEARRLAAELSERIAAVRGLPPLDEPPVTVAVEWTDPIMVGGHWVPEMIRLAGGIDPLGHEGAPSRYVDWEEVVAVKPEVMLLMPCGFGLRRTVEIAADFTGRPGFAGLPCAVAGGVVALDGSAYFNRPGPRIVDGLEILAAVLRGRRGEPLPPGAHWV